MRIPKIVAALILITACTALADPPASEPSTAPSSKAEKIDHLSATFHSMMLNGAELKYTATTGTITMKDDAGKPVADFFFVAYVKDGLQNAADRPITFVFNGGPGAASVWLHLGIMGPKRIALADSGLPGPPPHTLVENTESVLDVTDLVLIDPVGTGYSRPAEGQKPDAFYGVEQDTDSVSKFIRLYLTRYQRWNSPKFLAGESYGTTRAAALSQHLLDDYGIDLNGIMLFSTVLNFETLAPSEGNELPYALYLPTYTSVALFHHKIQTDDETKLRDEVSKYALNDYLAALGKGSSLSKDDRAAVVEHLAHYTGLPADLIDKANLRIGPSMFRKKLLNDERMVIGRFDARVTGLDPQPAHENETYDPSESLYLPVYSSTFNDYVRRDLKFESDLNYEVLSGSVNQQWDFGRSGMGYLDVTGSLRNAMLENPNMKILVCSGYDDMATPFLATDYTVNHLDMTDRLRQNVTQTYYHSGHMIYHDKESRLKLKKDIADFITAATQKP